MYDKQHGSISRTVFHHISKSMDNFHRISNAMENLYYSHLEFDKVIATKFCTFHDSFALVACVKFDSDLMAMDRIIAKRVSHRISIAMKKRSWNGPQKRVFYRTWQNLSDMCDLNIEKWFNYANAFFMFPEINSAWRRLIFIFCVPCFRALVLD